MDGISLYEDCVMLAYNKEVRRNCLPFTCGENDLDDFFLNDADLYASTGMDGACSYPNPTFEAHIFSGKSVVVE